MSEQSTLTDRLAAARDHLIEARRYVRSKPDVAQRMMAVARDMLWGTQEEVHGSGRRGDTKRLRTNLYVAAYEMLAVSPDAAIGYIDGVTYELSSIISDERKRSEAGARDEELMEGYGQ